MNLTPEQLPQALSRNLPRVMLCFGEEPERLGKSIDLIWQTARQAGFIEKQVLIVENQADWSDLIFTYQEQSLFSTQRMLLVHLNLKLNPSQVEQWQTLLAKPNTDILLVVRAGAVERKAQQAKWITAVTAAKGWLIHSKALEGRVLQDWLAQQVRVFGMDITPAALAQLAQWSQGNLLASRQSLERWQLQGILHIDDALLQQDQQDWARFDVFALVNAIVQRNLTQSLRVFDRLKDEGEDLVLILWAVSREVRTWKQLLIGTKNGSWGQATKALGIWQERADQLAGICRQLSLSTVNRWLDQLFTIDLMIKGQQQGSPDMALRWLIADMVSLGKQLPILEKSS